MEKQIFKKKYGIGDHVVENIGKCEIPVRDFADAIEEFLFKNFRGLVEVTGCDLPLDNIIISPEYVAFFFKELLSDIHGRGLLKIGMMKEDREYTLSFYMPKGVELDFYETNDLIRIARQAGFEVYFNDGTMDLTITLKESFSRSIYAISFSRKPAMVMTLKNMFFK